MCVSKDSQTMTVSKAPEGSRMLFSVDRKAFTCVNNRGLILIECWEQNWVTFKESVFRHESVVRPGLGVSSGLEVVSVWMWSDLDVVRPESVPAPAASPHTGCGA